MKDPFNKNQKEIIYEQVNVKLPVHERLMERIEQVDISEILSRRPLDTSERIVVFYGRSYWEHINYIETIMANLEKGYTLKTKIIQGDRKVYSSDAFFVSPDGYCEDPRVVINLLLAQYTALSKLVQKLDATISKNLTTKHNLKLLQDYILADALTFLESILREPTDLPVH